MCSSSLSGRRCGADRSRRDVPQLDRPPRLRRTTGGSGRVGAIASLGTARLRENADAFVVTQCARGQTGECRSLADRVELLSRCCCHALSVETFKYSKSRRIAQQSSGGPGRGRRMAASALRDGRNLRKVGWALPRDSSPTAGPTRPPEPARCRNARRPTWPRRDPARPVSLPPPDAR